MEAKDIHPKFFVSFKMLPIAQLKYKQFNKNLILNLYA
jgi:hypothetical protein